MRIKATSDWDAIRAEITESFSPGAPVEEKDLFAGRAHQINLLKDAVMESVA